MNKNKSKQYILVIYISDKDYVSLLHCVESSIELRNWVNAELCKNEYKDKEWELFSSHMKGGEMIIGKKFRKIASIVVLEKLDTGYLVYDGINENDKWVIAFDVFEKTYEEIK